jgi:DNA-binding NarL/FixJ family response regulator
MKILVVDDHLILREGLAALLRQSWQDAVILQGRDADAGLRAAEENPDLDVVFLDLNMPGMNGMTGIQHFVQRFPRLPLIILSSSENPAEVRRALALGAVGYVPKSASPQTLISALRLVLAGDIYLPPLLLDAPPLPGRRPADESGGLTDRQVEVLVALCNGLSNKEIGRKLDLSEKTVKAHITAIFRALNVVNRTQAANAARVRGLVTP